MRSRPAIEDVAARAGFSRQTASRINNKGEVSAATRIRVLAATGMLEDAQAEAHRRGYFILTGSVSTKPGVLSTGQKAIRFLGRTPVNAERFAFHQLP